MASCTFNDQRSSVCESHNLDWSLLFMGGALALLGMGHRGIGGAIARNLGTVALGTAAASLLHDRSWTANPEYSESRATGQSRIQEPQPASLRDSVDVAGYESFPASDPPAIR
jgi:hypothetical protein